MAAPVTRDDFLAGANDEPAVCGEGRQVFLVAIESEGRDTERFVRAAIYDYFGSMAVAVKRVEKPSCDQVLAT